MTYIFQVDDWLQLADGPRRPKPFPHCEDECAHMLICHSRKPWKHVSPSHLLSPLDSTSLDAFDPRLRRDLHGTFIITLCLKKLEYPFACF